MLFLVNGLIEILGFVLTSSNAPNGRIEGDLGVAGRHYMRRWALLVLTLGIASVLTHYYVPDTDRGKIVFAIGWLGYHIGMIYQMGMEPSNVVAGVVVHGCLVLWFLKFLFSALRK